MIYVCVPVHNEARTAGLVLWKVRQVFTAFPREYQLLVLDDASTDDTREVLASYAKVLPMTIVTHRERRGYAQPRGAAASRAPADRPAEARLRHHSPRRLRPFPRAHAGHGEAFGIGGGPRGRRTGGAAGASVAGPGPGAPLDPSAAARRRAARHGVGIPRPAAHRASAAPAPRHTAGPAD